MTLPNFNHLQAQPDLLLTWLQSNLLLAGSVQNVGAVGSGGGIAPMTIGAYAGPVQSATNAANGAQMGFHALRNDPNGQLSAYICNYQANDKRSVPIGTNADFCFTITLNGCTFAVGPVQAGNTRLVSHANSGGNTVLQRQQTRTAQQSGNLAGVALLEPANYRRLSQTQAISTTVFGIRTGLAWKFYFQVYAYAGGNATVYGVFPFPDAG
jgi:hypothetical protein